MLNQGVALSLKLITSGYSKVDRRKGRVRSATQWADEKDRRIDIEEVLRSQENHWAAFANLSALCWIEPSQVDSTAG